MPWICRTNQCHKSQEGFAVVRDEYREDTITSRFAATDQHLAEALSDKVYPGIDSEYGTAQCACCGEHVVWEPEKV